MFSPAAELALVFIAILASWPLVLTLMKRMGGWGALEQRYPGKTTTGEKYRFSSLGFRKDKGLPMNYGACVTITVSDSGLGFNTFFPFSASHKAFFIPWNAITVARRIKIFMTGATALTVKNIDRSLIVWDFTGNKVFEACSKNGVAVSES
jgi:hypothetical protein